jgi:hypothetical protein
VAADLGQLRVEPLDDRDGRVLVEVVDDQDLVRGRDAGTGSTASPSLKTGTTTESSTSSDAMALSILTGNRWARVMPACRPHASIGGRCPRRPHPRAITGDNRRVNLPANAIGDGTSRLP